MSWSQYMLNTIINCYYLSFRATSPCWAGGDCADGGRAAEQDGRSPRRADPHQLEQADCGLVALLRLARYPRSSRQVQLRRFL